MAVQLDILESSFVVRNISDVAVNILGAIIQPDHQVDLFDAVASMTETTVISALSKPRGAIYVNAILSQKIEIVSFALITLGLSVSEGGGQSLLYGVPASSTSDGYLSSEDWNRFTSGSGLNSARSPLFLDGGTVAIGLATGLADGYLSKEDWNRFDASSGGVVDAIAPLSITSGTVRIPKATSVIDGYLSKEDWIRFDAASGGGISEIQHKMLRQLVHLADRGPFEGFASGAFRETLPVASPFPTSFIWWTSSSKTAKIVDKVITYGNTRAKISQVQYKVYDTDGVTVLATVTDTISYNGIFETSRTRTIV